MIEKFRDGTAAFASARESAWHRLGTVTTDAMTAEDAMQKAYLGGWNVRKIALTGAEITDDGVESVEFPEHFGTVRTHPKTGKPEWLGVVGTDYQPVQNEEHAEFLNLLVEESGAHFETAGSLRGGRQVFLTMKLPQTMTVGGHDRVDLYIAAFNGHDGGSAFRVVTTPVRVVCANTQRAALRNAVSSVSIRHTKNAKSRIIAAREALDLTFTYAEEFEKAAQRMIEAEMSTGELRDAVARMWPEQKDESRVTQRNREQRLGKITDLFERAETQANIRGTRWAGFQAITEYVEHFAPSRGKTEAAKGDARAERLINGSQDALMRQAFELTAV
ncbi:DUF932 domain-containing protein [Streptomyces nanshensis]|nr:DUF932 domain-containing protein [Streptomyces nanshensis]